METETTVGTELELTSTAITTAMVEEPEPEAGNRSILERGCPFLLLLPVEHQILQLSELLLQLILSHLSRVQFRSLRYQLLFQIINLLMVVKDARCRHQHQKGKHEVNFQVHLV